MTESRIAIPAPPQPQQTPTRQRRISWWRLALPLTLQTLLIVALPARNAYVFATGTTVVLQTVPVDPYDLLRGYYQTLSYEVSQVDRLADLPGGNTLFSDQNQGKTFNFYVVLEAPAPSTAQPPPPWQPVRVTAEFPEDLTREQVALRGRYDRWRIIYDLETYYMPEAQRDRLNTAIQDVQRSEPEAFRVEVRVGDRGEAVPASLWVRDRRYQF